MSQPHEEPARDGSCAKAASEDPEIEIIEPSNGESPLKDKEVNAGAATTGKSPSPLAAMPPPPERKWRQMTFGVANEAAYRKEITERDSKIDELRAAVTQAETENTVLHERMQELEGSLKDLDERIARYQDVMREVMKTQAESQRREARRNQHNMNFEVGQVLMVHNIAGPQEMWVHGNRYREILTELAALHARVTEVEACEREARMSRRVSSSRLTRTLTAQQASHEVDGSAATGTAPTIGGSLIESIWEAEEQAELHKVELGHLKTRIDALNAEKESLEGQRFSLLKEIRRIDDEDTSDFASQAAIGADGRYVLLHLLGKGGFSEVWKAFDLSEARFVACKIHRLNKNWSHQTKQNYLRHAERELEIQRQLDHPRVTKLFDVFECNPPSNTFVSVTEFCGGVDLDTHLKRARQIRESEARVILMQIVSGLRHLWESGIIHFDLKPANVLFHSELSTCLEIKITDFGLAKKIAAEGNSNDPSIELTSQGAGTMWYCPPECFEENAKISKKVDVWAAGVIFYQMLYGRLPFADGESQRRIWSEKLITKFVARGLEFPQKPYVSNEAKDFIRRCLSESPSQRPDPIQLSTDPYLCQYARKRPRSALTMAATAGPVVPAASPHIPSEGGSFRGMSLAGVREETQPPPNKAEKVEK